MADFTLVIGNKNYSSWSLRGWLMARIADIERITGLWRDCRKRFAGAAANKDEGFLFGTISAADAMYAPVATRFRTYGVKLDTDSEAYCTAVLNYAPMKAWTDDAKNEPW